MMHEEGEGAGALTDGIEHVQAVQQIRRERLGVVQALLDPGWRLGSRVWGRVVRTHVSRSVAG